MQECAEAHPHSGNLLRGEFYAGVGIPTMLTRSEFQSLNRPPEWWLTFPQPQTNQGWGLVDTFEFNLEFVFCV